MRSYIEFRKQEYIRPVQLANKNKYYTDLINIEHSWSGRIDGGVCNTFIMEAENQLINAIELFEQGYFDCAYYSLRSAVELSTTMVYLADMPENERELSLQAWKDTKDFPMQGRMLKELSQRGSVFVDLKAKMPDFFASVKKLSAELNKYVHKQGLQHFYVSRNHAINTHKPQDAFIETFEDHLRRSIGVVAVMRLAIDPFPVLLMDEDILYRCFDSMTDPYSDGFVKEYIGDSVIESYKQTEIYNGTYDAFIQDERKDEVVFNVMKHQYIDTKQFDKIFAQLHLLPKEDVICVLLVSTCDKAVKVYCFNGLQMYFTDRNTNRRVWSWSGLDFHNFAMADDPVNQKYDEAFITVFKFDDMAYFVEHNELLSIDEVKSMEESVLYYFPEDKG